MSTTHPLSNYQARQQFTSVNKEISHNGQHTLAPSRVYLALRHLVATSATNDHQYTDITVSDDVSSHSDSFSSTRLFYWQLLASTPPHIDWRSFAVQRVARLREHVLNDVLNAVAAEQINW